jgi:KUP system potassium uptake protein
MSLLAIKRGTRTGIVVIGVLGAALLYGDGAITPAISVLSALEGLKLPVPAIAPDIVPLSLIVLVGVFGLQPQGSARIGKLFGFSWPSGSLPSVCWELAACCIIQAR